MIDDGAAEAHDHRGQPAGVAYEEMGRVVPPERWGLTGAHPDCAVLLAGCLKCISVGHFVFPMGIEKSVVTRVSNPIPRQSLAAAVVERLREKIISGELHEGEQLRQGTIADEFQISRIPVREALSHLAAEGLITIVANRGAVVSALSPEEIMQIFEARAVLECYMLRQAIPNFKEEDFQRAEAILKQYEKSLEEESNIKSWGQLNWNFHSALYAPAHRPAIMSFLKTLNNNCERYTRLHLDYIRKSPQAVEAHRQLLDICKTRDPEFASAALWKHITEAGEYLRELIKSRREHRP